VAITTAKNFYVAANNSDSHDGGWGSDVDHYRETSPGNATGTQNNHPSSAGTTTITMDPYSTRATTGNATQDYGWAWNADAGSDFSMGSTDGAKRWLRAGVWTFRCSIAIPAGGSITGSHNVIVTAYVYRVGPSPSFTRTLLFSAASPEQSGGLFGATANYNFDSPSQPEYVLEAGETIHVGFTTTNRQVAGALGATTAGSLPITLNNGGLQVVRVPSLGIGTLGITKGESFGNSTTQAEVTALFSAAGSANGSSQSVGVAGSTSGAVGLSTASAEVDGIGSSTASTIGYSESGSISLGVITNVFSTVGQALGEASVEGILTGIFSGIGVADGSSSIDGRITNLFSVVGLSQGVAAANGAGSSVAGTVANSNAGGVVSGKASLVLGTVGAVSVSEGGGETLIRPIILLCDD